MNILRNEIRTGLLVVLSLAALVALLLYLGSPGVFVSQKTFYIYFDNAAGLEPGAPVLLAGRKIGRVRKLNSPVAEKDRPSPKMETLVEVQVASSAAIFNKVKAQMTQPSMLGKHVIDFTSGEEASGLAKDGTYLIGERQGGLADAVPTLLDKMSPVLLKATSTLDSIQKTADNLTGITDEGSDMRVALSEVRKFGTNLNQLSGPGSSLQRSLQHLDVMTSDEGKLGVALDHIAAITAPGSDLTKTFANSEKFTAKLSANKDIEIMLRNFRQVSETLDRKVERLGNMFSEVAANLAQASDTVKRQPWRLIWPSTKKYEPEDRAAPVTVAKPKIKAVRK
jgi:hypothetical protein